MIIIMLDLEVCKDVHVIAVFAEWDEFVEYDWKKIYDEASICI